MQTDEVKAINILKLSEGTLKILAELRADLDSRFSRNPKPEKGAEGVTPEAPNNVLDEIIGNLQDAKSRLYAISSLLRDEVYPKIN